MESQKIKDVIREMREKSPKRNFDQSVELIINLRDIDLKKPEGRIQEKIELPRQIGKKVNVCVFANGDMALRARRGGANLVLESSEIERLASDKKRQREIASSMDSFISSAPLMPLVGRSFGSILGPRGKMPTPIAPTANIIEEIERQKRTIFTRVRGQPVLQCRIGTEKLSDDEMADNIQAVLRRITSRLKRGDRNIDSVYLKTTMGPPVEVSI